MRGSVDGAAFLPVGATEARVCAVDDDGNPALLVRNVGAGRIVVSTDPLEYLASRTPRVNPDDVVQLYGALAQLAGVEPTVSVDDPRVIADTMEHEDGRVFAWMVSQADDTVTATPRLQAGARLTDLDGGSHSVEQVTIEPFGVRVFQLNTPPAGVTTGEGR